jgi:hypothetical protein
VSGRLVQVELPPEYRLVVAKNRPGIRGGADGACHPVPVAVLAVVLVTVLVVVVVAVHVCVPVAGTVIPDST